MCASQKVRALTSDALKIEPTAVLKHYWRYVMFSLLISAQFWKLNVLDNTLESKNGELFFFFSNILQITPLDGDAEIYVIENIDNTTQVMGLENDETDKGIC